MFFLFCFVFLSMFLICLYSLIISEDSSLICQFGHFLCSRFLFLLLFLLFCSSHCVKGFFFFILYNFFSWSFIYFVPSILIRKTLIAMKLSRLLLPWHTVPFVLIVMLSYSFSWHATITVLFLFFDPRARCLFFILLF